MASHQAGRGRDERAGAEDFESGLDYGAFVEDDAADDPNRTQALPATGRDDDGGAQHTSALSPEVCWAPPSSSRPMAGSAWVRFGSSAASSSTNAP